MWKKVGKVGLALLAAMMMVSATAFFAQSVVTQLSGLAVAQNVPTTIWNSVRDAVAGDDLVNGILAAGLYVLDGSTFDLITGDTTNGLDVDVTRVQGTVTVTQATAGTSFFAITDTGITTGSQNFSFGFTSKTVSVSAPSGNATSVCVDWLGGTAVCASADTAGDDLIAPGETVLLANYAVTSISAIASAGTETITIRAWE